MPKKTRKMKERAAMRRVPGTFVPPSEAEADDAAVAEAPVVAPARAILGANRVLVTPQTYDYSHIYSDLKRIALFAGFFFIVLIVLSFVIK